MKKKEFITGLSLLVLSPVIYLGVFYFGTQACRKTTYALCNYTTLGILYIPIYIAIAMAFIGMVLILIALSQRVTKK